MLDFEDSIINTQEMTIAAFRQRIAKLEAKAAVVDLLNKAIPGPALMSMSGNIMIDFNGEYEDSKAAYDALITARTLLQEPRA